MKILVTGSAGFIGFHTTMRLLERGDEVVGLDNLNDYYDPALKLARLAESGIAVEDIAASQAAVSAKYPQYRFFKMDLHDRDAMASLFERERFDVVCHLAAQAGVRYSLKNPHAYVDSNLVGFVNVLEGCRHTQVKHLVYASSSSVYGSNTRMPFSTRDNVDHPVSLYAATKKANELMAHTYSHLYGIPTTGLRFFTVYGPWGRPDMAYFLFAKAIMEGRPIDVYNHGNMRRDFTYIEDIVEGVVRVLDKPAMPDDAYRAEQPDPGASHAPYRVFNIGNSEPVALMEFIEALESAIGKPAQKNFLPMQPGDVPATYADVSALEDWVGFKPYTPVRAGVENFVTWFTQYLKQNAVAA